MFNGKRARVHLSTSVPIEVTFYSLSHQKTNQIFPVVISEKKTNMSDTTSEVTGIKREIEISTKKMSVVNSKKTIKQKHQIQMKNNVEEPDVQSIKQYKMNATEERNIYDNDKNVETHQSPDSKERLYSVQNSQCEGVFFDTNDFKYAYYADQIKRKINRNWKCAESYGKFRALIYFKIRRDGSVFDISIKESSENIEYDKNTLDAIRRAVPFPELPESYKSESLGVFFEFKYQ
jgi:protein TonB